MRNDIMSIIYLLWSTSCISGGFFFLTGSSVFYKILKSFIFTLQVKKNKIPSSLCLCTCKSPTFNFCFTESYPCPTLVQYDDTTKLKSINRGVRNIPTN